MAEYHIPVLLKPSVDLLGMKPEGVYVDATFGGGGHSREMLSRLTTGKLIAFDQDPDARKNVQNQENLVFIPKNFAFLEQGQHLERSPLDGGIDGVLTFLVGDDGIGLFGGYSVDEFLSPLDGGEDRASLHY